jgi:putative spermidine/putrescine transport system substrate-binding protein
MRIALLARLLAVAAVAVAAEPVKPHPPAAAPSAAAAPAAAKPRPAPTPPAHPGPPPLLAALSPDAPGEMIRRILLKPYATATGTELATLSWSRADGPGKVIASHGADLLLVDAATLADLCHSQALARIDWSALDRARMQPGAATDCGVGAYLAQTALAWDRARFSGTPSWADVWDIARHPGRRGLQNRARGNLELALLADGFSPGDIYRTLRTPEGLDRAFRKLDQLKPYIVWWDQPSQATDLLATGKALLTSAPVDSATAAAAAKPGLGVSAAGSLATWFSWAVPQGAPHQEAARLALVIAGDPARQAELARATGFGPADSLALDLLPPHPEPLLLIDDGFWAEDGAKVEARFAEWKAK